ncbi:unnamed protein product, partial [Amoebophrya sp. A25]
NIKDCGARTIVGHDGAFSPVPLRPGEDAWAEIRPHLVANRLIREFRLIPQVFGYVAFLKRCDKFSEVVVDTTTSLEKCLVFHKKQKQQKRDAEVEHEIKGNVAAASNTNKHNKDKKNRNHLHIQKKNLDHVPDFSPPAAKDYGTKIVLPPEVREAVENARKEKARRSFTLQQEEIFGRSDIWKEDQHGRMSSRVAFPVPNRRVVHYRNEHDYELEPLAGGVVVPEQRIESRVLVPARKIVEPQHDGKKERVDEKKAADKNLMLVEESASTKINKQQDELTAEGAKRTLMFE